MNKGAGLLFFVTIFFGCKQKEEPSKDTDYFPATAYIHSQIAHVDTSVFSIIKIVQLDSTFDTTYIKREDFKKEAADFLTLPDISSKKLRTKYEESKQFDEALQKITFAYTSKEEDQLIQQEVVVVKPDPNIDKVEMIFIDWLQADGDSTVQKKLTWQANKYFRKITMTQKKGQPEKVERIEVHWTDPSAE
ncbi:MAG: hypothetical protein ABIN57_09515 [Chitinophagaceae bacterium]